LITAVHLYKTNLKLSFANVVCLSHYLLFCLFNIVCVGTIWISCHCSNSYCDMYNSNHYFSNSQDE